ncbi:hypothetical protein QCA50_001985 [Cerrena zonata]|uniref:Uncharacterized protein n=1 Tax=Cerrena zonata TaxID=2478898 RepID=A0AAW0GX07_9APHY
MASSPPKPSRQPRKSRAQKRKTHDSRRNWQERVDAWHQVDAADWGSPYDSGFNPSIAQVRVYEHQSRVDRLRDVVPFWRDGVAAAEAGEETGKWEEFYKKLDEQPTVDDNNWPTAMDDPWGWTVDPKKDGEDPWATPAKDAWNAPTPTWGWGEPPAEPEHPQPAGGWGDLCPLLSPTPSLKPISQPKSNHFENSDAWSKQSRNKHQQKNGGVNPRKLRSFVDKLVRDDHASPERKELLHQFCVLPTEEKVKKIQEVANFLRSHV